MSQITFERAVSIIILLLIITFVGYAYLHFYLSSADAANRASCHVSLAATLGTTIAGVYSPFDLYCPRKVLEVQENRVVHLDYTFFETLQRPRGYFYERVEYNATENTLRIRQGATVSSDADSLEPALADMFAYELSSCWNLFREGEIDVLRTDSSFRQSNVCVLCAEIFVNRSFDSFTLDLEEHFQTQYTPHERTRPITFQDYLFHDDMPSTPRTCLASFPSFDELTIQQYSSYSVVFFRTGRLFRTLTDSNALGCQAVGIIPTEYLYQQCDALVN